MNHKQYRLIEKAAGRGPNIRQLLARAGKPVRKNVRIAYKIMHPTEKRRIVGFALPIKNIGLEDTGYKRWRYIETALNHRGHGYGGGYLKENTKGLNRVVAYIKDSNIGAQKIYSRAGFVKSPIKEIGKIKKETYPDASIWVKE